jgi:membrane-bound metal-dependent hydrolase YbcI (DUF457 family)
MIGPTHLLLGAAAAVPAAALAGQPWLVAVGFVGGLWPDLDLSETTLANWRLMISAPSRGHRAVYIRPFAWLGALAQSSGEHRGWWHSLPAALLFSSIAWLGGSFGGLAFLGGYLSHLLGDAATVSGVEIWPGRRWHLLPNGWRLKTGSPIENIISTLAALAVLFYLLPLLFNGLLS